ncbi:NUDIX domain-containing protein [Bacteroides sp. 214]|uniref:NUDIX hydrolase n=1 Tax=Bacteroides sp. 214 TaxID=2302935 RepID=UPI0013D2F686|nr:NUDIX domain-containing protein [Bacteroides sp. 214]NDW11489.1 NUDIX domain-containing protein [Bacteroides sp. 214]
MSQTPIKTPLANNHISVDCVVLGFENEELKVLLIKRMGEDNGSVFRDMKLPGSLIYTDENLDDAAKRVLNELTGVKNISLSQFKAFGSKNRTSDPKDVRWLERAMESKVERIVTIAYVAMVKIGKMFSQSELDEYQACWVGINDVPSLAFDHNLIIKEALVYMRQFVELNPAILFDLLPRKFTAAQLRTLFELVYERKVDVRNFHKKIAMMEYVVQLDERQKGVPHRAARYYKFDKKIYNKQRK